MFQAGEAVLFHQSYNVNVIFFNIFYFTSADRNYTFQYITQLLSSIETKLVRTHYLHLLPHDSGTPKPNHCITLNEFSCSLLQYKTVYKKTVHTRNVTVTLNLTDSLNVTESKLSVNLSRVLHTIQVGGSGRHLHWRKRGHDDFKTILISVYRIKWNETYI